MPRCASIILLCLACAETGSAPPAGSGGAGGSVAIDASADAPHVDANPMMPDAAPQTPHRRGLWIWSMQGRADPPSVVAANAQRWGIQFVVIQAANPPGNSLWTENFNAGVIAEFTSRGIDVYGMTWVIPDDPNAMPAKIATAAAIANVSGSRGVIMDSEWQWFGHAADATSLCRGTRAQAPGKFIGYTATFNYFAPGGQYTGTPQYFPDFPWHAFDADCGDGFFPQSYFSEQSNPDPVAMWNFTRSGAQQLGLNAPLWPITDFNDHQVSVADLDVFFALAGEHASLWRYPYPDDALRDVNHQQLGQIHFSANSGDAGLGGCTYQGWWCGRSPGSPAGASPNTLSFCPAGGNWQRLYDCAQCFTCPEGVADTCDQATASANGCQ